MIFLVAGSSAFGQTPFATIDYRTCLVLHPEMATFDFVAQRFSRPNLKRNDSLVMEQVYKSMQAKQKSLAPKIEALLAKQGKLQENMSKARLNWTTMGAKLAGQNLSKNEIEKRIEETQNRDQKKIDKMQQEFSDIENEIVSLKDSIWQDVFLTRAETVKKLEKIIGELDAVIADTSKELKVACVIDDTLNSSETPDEILNHIPENTPLWANPVYQTILKSPLPEPNTFTIANHWAPSLMKSIENLSFQYLSRRQDVGSLVSTIRPSKLFISGGLDITEKVCRSIFKKYKFNSYLTESLVKGIKMFRER